MIDLNPGRTTKIIAPAGCGKTTYLIGIVEELLAAGTRPEMIVFTTFTRAAAYEARDRACEKFNLPEERFPYFRTLHSLCLRFLGRRDVMSFRDYLWVAKDIGVSITFRGAGRSDSAVTLSKGDHLLNCYNLARLTGRELDEMHAVYTDRQRITLQELRHFCATLEGYKLEYDKIDYTDMLSEFLTLAPRPTISHLIVDESQDLCPLQWSVISHLAKFCERTYLAGDDDQCIHEYAGASPDILVDLDCSVNLREQSFRVPVAVQKVADSITTRIAKRIKKTIRPTKHLGEVFHAANLDSMELHDGSWFMLARNNAFLYIFEDYLIRKGQLFTLEDNRESQYIRMDMVASVIEWARLREHQTCTAAQLKTIYRSLRCGKEYEKGSLQKVQALADRETVTLKQAVEKFGLLRGDPWEMMFELSDTEHNYLSQCAGNNPVFPPARFHIASIHAVKGREADNVALLPDMTQQTWMGYRKEPDPEHRVWYVGVTRARQRLYLLAPYTNKFYDI